MHVKFRIMLFVLVTGAGIMMVEISAPRLAAPYFGTSTIVWANIIGLVLGTLAVGYAIGGRLADRYPNKAGLALIALIAGWLSLLIPFISTALLQSMTGNIMQTPMDLLIRSFIGTMLLFMPPVFFLAMASPYALRLSLADPGHSGNTAGTLYALSTIGSLAGTFLPALLIIPLLGVRAAFLLAALFLFIACLLVAGKRLAVIAVLSAAVALFLLLAEQGNATAGNNHL